MLHVKSLSLSAPAAARSSRTSLHSSRSLQRPLPRRCIAQWRSAVASAVPPIRLTSCTSIPSTRTSPHILSLRAPSSNPTSSSAIRIWRLLSTKSERAKKPQPDLLDRLESKERYRKLFKRSIIFLVIFGLLMYLIFVKPSAAADGKIHSILAKLSDPDYKDPSETPARLLQILFDETKYNDRWRSKLADPELGLVATLARYIRSQDVDQRSTAALLLSIISNKKSNKAAIVKDGLLDVMITHNEAAVKAATLIILNNILNTKNKTKQEVRKAVLTNRSIMEYLMAHQNDHEPLLRTYAKLALNSAGYITLDQGQINTLNMLVKAFDYTRPVDKETMATSMRTLASGNRNDPYIQFCQAYWFQLFGYATEAKIAYSKALQLDPSQPDALFELSRIYMLEFQDDKAVLLKLRLCQENPMFPPLVRENESVFPLSDRQAQLRDMLEDFKRGKKIELPAALFPSTPTTPAPAVASTK